MTTYKGAVFHSRLAIAKARMGMAHGLVKAKPWNESDVKRSEGQFASVGEKAVATAKARANAPDFEEDESPMTSPYGGKLIEFKRDEGGKTVAVYEDGAIYDGLGFQPGHGKQMKKPAPKKAPPKKAAAKKAPAKKKAAKKKEPPKKAPPAPAKKAPAYGPVKLPPARGTVPGQGKKVAPPKKVGATNRNRQIAKAGLTPEHKEIHRNLKKGEKCPECGGTVLTPVGGEPVVTGVSKESKRPL